MQQLGARADLSHSAEELHNLMVEARPQPLGQREILERAQGLAREDIEAAERGEAKTPSLGGDHADFHNLATEAFRCSLFELSLDVIDAGLLHCGQNTTLIGDKIQAMLGSGRTHEAIDLGLRYWRDLHPRVFASDWRPATFLRRGVEQIDPSYETQFPEAKRSLLPKASAVGNKESKPKWGDVVEEALQAVNRENPSHIKVWHALAEVQHTRGRAADAINTLRGALKANPLSQQLCFALGERFLTSARDQGAKDKVNEAIHYLSKALQVDYQDGFQHDVAARAIILRLAQAYEAKATIAEDPAAIEKARMLYQQFEQDEDAEPTFRDYASTRERCLRTYESDRIEFGADEQTPDERAVETEQQEKPTQTEIQARNRAKVFAWTTLVVCVPWILSVALAALRLNPHPLSWILDQPLKGLAFWLGLAQAALAPLAGLVCGILIRRKTVSAKACVPAGAIATALVAATGIALIVLSLL